MKICTMWKVKQEVISLYFPSRIKKLVKKRQESGISLGNSLEDSEEGNNSWIRELFTEKWTTTRKKVIEETKSQIITCSIRWDNIRKDMRHNNVQHNNYLSFQGLNRLKPEKKTKKEKKGKLLTSRRKQRSKRKERR